MVYKDMTFCHSDCINRCCHRHISHTEGNTDDLPISWADYSDSCVDYSAEQYKEREPE